MTLVAVVGGRGVIGREIVSRLREVGHEVIVVTHRRSVTGRWMRYGDLMHPETLPPAIAGAEVVVQSANFPNYPMEHPKKGWTFREFDERGTRRLVDAADRVGIRRFVFIAGAGANRYPSDGSTPPYFQALQAGERAVIESGLEYVCIEPTVVVTPTDNGLNRLLRVARATPLVLPVPGGHQVHQPVWGGDLAEVVAGSLERDSPQGIFEIGGPERMTLLQMLATLLRVAGVRRKLMPIPMGPVLLAGNVAEHLPGGWLTRRGAEFLSEDFVADNEKTLSAFGVVLHGLEECLRSYLGPAGSRSR